MTGRGRHHPRMLFVIGGGLGLAVCCMTIFHLISGYRHQWHTLQERSEALGAITDAHVSGLLSAIDIALHAAAEEAERQLLVEGRACPDMGRYMRYQRNLFPVLETLFFADSDGIIRSGSGIDQHEDVPIADRSYFKRAQAEAMSATAPPILAEPLISRITGHIVLPIVRRVDAADGRFLGIIGAAISTRHLRHHCAALPLARHEAIAFQDPEGNTFLRLPEGSQMRPGPDWLVETRRMNGYPLSVVTGMSLDHGLAAWRQEALFILILLSGLLLALTSGLVFLQRAWKNEAEAHDQAERILQADQERLEELVAIRSQELERERQRFEHYFTLSRTVTVILDREGRVQRLNPYGGELLGWHEEELRDRDWFASCLPPDNADKVRAYFFEQIHADATRIAQFEQESYENELQTRDGRRLSILWRNAWLHDDSGHITGSLSTGIDISHLRHTEDLLLQAKQAAEQANKAKSDFLANISHHFKTPLNGILGYAQMLKQVDLPPEWQHAITVIHDSGNHLLRLITDIVTMAQLETGRCVCQLTNVDLHHLLHQLVDQQREQAASKGVAIHLHLHPQLPSAIRTDAEKLQLIVGHLLNNAVSFTDSGTIRVTARGNDAQLCLTVSDAGPGISEAEQEQLFQPFVQFRRNQGWRTGTGLGLALARGCARVLDGDVSVRSQTGQGATFIVDMPVALPTGPTAPPPPQAHIPATPFDPSVLAAIESERIRTLHDIILLGDVAQAQAELAQWPEGAAKSHLAQLLRHYRITDLHTILQRATDTIARGDGP